MPGKYALNRDAGVLVTSYRGEVTMAEIRSLTTQRNADPSLASVRFHLIDMEEIVVKTSAEDVRKFADFVSRLAPLPSVERTASINADGVAFGFGRMLESLLDAKGVKSAASHFRTFREAIEWLGVDEASTRAFLDQLRHEIDCTLGPKS